MKAHPKVKVQDLSLYEYKKLWEEEWNADKTDKYNLVELMNQVQGQGKSCLDYWIEINTRAAEIELDNKTSTDIEQLLEMAVFLDGTTKQKHVVHGKWFQDNRRRNKVAW